tara:strand:- start:386 stop:1486 length:1101 start_codon:yes stop_codon:yes gene_type:complete
MKKLLILMLVSAPVFADYTMVIPQKVGGGTSVWASIVAKELEKQLDEKIRLVHIPSARGIGGFNKFHNNLRFDDKTIMVSHGGNGVSFLQENVEYNYADYESIGLMNLNIIVGRLKDNNDKIKFAFGSGQVPEAMAMSMLICGEPSVKDTEQAIDCFRDNVTWVKGMKGNERRLAFKRGELNVTRENPAAYKKHVESFAGAEVWFTHGILNDLGFHEDDINYPNVQFELLYEQKYGKAPEGEFYDAYKLTKSFRDGLQKALWVNAGNPNKDKLIEALRRMTNNPESTNRIMQKVGDYDWVIGDEGDGMRDTLMSFITEDALKNLVEFNQKALDLKSVYKEELIYTEIPEDLIKPQIPTYGDMIIRG